MLFFKELIFLRAQNRALICVRRYSTPLSKSSLVFFRGVPLISGTAKPYIQYPPIPSHDNKP